MASVRKRGLEPLFRRAPAERVVKSAERTLDILELLAASGREMTHGEIARRLAVPKSSLTHLLRSLARRGYVATKRPGDVLRNAAAAIGARLEE